LVGSFGFVGCGGTPAAFGEPCLEGTDCESGRCEDLGSALGRACTQDCGAGTLCGSGTVCDPDLGYCTTPCTAGTISGSGETTEVCRAGLFQACSAQDDVAFCDVCGCAPFGGGTCVDDHGCIELRADGETCSADFECRGGVCYRDGNTCGTRRAMGEGCRVDAECTSGNCSTDGDVTAEGVCNQPLGSACDASSSTSATCTRCIATDFIGDRGMCSRRACDPEHAPECPQLTERSWECVRTTSGGHACFEDCSRDDYYRCLESGDFCQRGYCQ
jgi:hypothetical protein